MSSRVQDPGASALLTDYYQLTMLKSYFELGMHETAAFEFFVRKLPPARNFLMAAGLEPVLRFLEDLRFDEQELEWLSGQPGFSRPFIGWLERFRFTGDVHAMPEGSIFFPDEPILRVVAPLPQAQLVETRLIALLHYSTLVASKAARTVLVARGRLLVDFGLRRAHGAEAGMLAARAAYIAGFDGTATVLAGQRYGIPLFGTMAHSYILAHADESEAYANFAHAHPQNTTLLIDTYDTEAGAARVVALVPRLRAQGIEVRAVRLDSGDLSEHARKVRRILDAGGCGHVRIFASGGLDEEAVAHLADAPIDGFGVGTSLTTVADAPMLDCAYKLQEYAGHARRKRSEGKVNWPGCKQVFRSVDDAGCLARDLLAMEGERHPGATLMQPVMRAGKRLGPAQPLAALRQHAAAELRSLPESLRGLSRAVTPYRVDVSPALRHLAAEVDRLQTESSARAPS